MCFFLHWDPPNPGNFNDAAQQKEKAKQAAAQKKTGTCHPKMMAALRSGDSHHLSFSRLAAADGAGRAGKVAAAAVVVVAAIRPKQKMAPL